MPKRGRPPKFNRPSRLIAMTLPEDAIASLRARDRDLARAVVALVGEADSTSTRSAVPPRVVDLVQVAPSRFLITIDPRAVRGLAGCELVPFGSDAALLALEPGRGLADLALAVVDRLDDPHLDRTERQVLKEIRAAFREWMRDPYLSYEIRSILVVQRLPHKRRGKAR